MCSSSLTTVTLFTLLFSVGCQIAPKQYAEKWSDDNQSFISMSGEKTRKAKHKASAAVKKKKSVSMKAKTKAPATKPKTRSKDEMFALYNPGEIKTKDAKILADGEKDRFASAFD